MYATIGILEALFHRQRTGRGQQLQVSLLESVLTWTGYFPYMYWYGGKLPQRVGLHHHTMAPYGPYPCRDGKQVILAAGGGHVEMWRKFCQAIERIDMFDDPLFANNNSRLANRTLLDKNICEAIGKHDRPYWLDCFHKFGIPSGAMNDLGEALSHPAIEARGFIKEVDSAVGKVKVFDFPPQSSETQSVNELGPPALGEHTAKVLAQFGYSPAEIDAMRKNGVIQCADAQKETEHA
jgi:formyl-CoA transferase